MQSDWTCLYIDILQMPKKPPFQNGCFIRELTVNGQIALYSLYSAISHTVIIDAGPAEGFPGTPPGVLPAIVRGSTLDKQ